MHFEACGVDYYLAVEEDLVGFAEGEGELVLFHEFAVLFAAFAFHFGYEREREAPLSVVWLWKKMKSSRCADGVGVEALIFF